MHEVQLMVLIHARWCSIYITTQVMLRFLSRLPTSPLLSRSFATANTRDRVDYYGILEVESGATEKAIRQAYAELTEGLRPEKDGKKWKLLNEAFVILTDNKTRDAYDSLLSVRKTHYMSEEKSTAPLARSYLATRRADRVEQLRKKVNIDEFGRFKGGLPNKSGTIRGRAKGEVGETVTQSQIEEEHDTHPEYINVTAEKAEAFKNFHQDEREARTMKWPWFSFEVDYDFFRLSTFRRRSWPMIKYAVILLYIVPAFFYALDSVSKGWYSEELRRRAEAKKE